MSGGVSQCATYREHVVALGVGFFSLLVFLHVELAEEVERQHGVQVDNDTCQHKRQDQLQQPANSINIHVLNII